MNWKRAARYALVSLVLVSGCSSLPGLRVLTGEDTGEAGVDRSVQALDLVMADKSGGTDPSLLAAADRIEAASGNVDIIEIRQNVAANTFDVNMLFSPPNVPNTLEGQAMIYDALRRAVELTWQAVLPESIGTDKIDIHLLQPQQINTLDSGESFIGRVIINAEIDRSDAAHYLTGTRDLNTFYGLIVEGKLSYKSPDALEMYAGQPNHPMFMLQTDTTES